MTSEGNKAADRGQMAGAITVPAKNRKARRILFTNPLRVFEKYHVPKGCPFGNPGATRQAGGCRPPRTLNGR